MAKGLLPYYRLHWPVVALNATLLLVMGAIGKRPWGGTRWRGGGGRYWSGESGIVREGAGLVDPHSRGNCFDCSDSNDQLSRPKL